MLPCILSVSKGRRNLAQSRPPRDSCHYEGQHLWEPRMSKLDLVTQVAETIYQLRPQCIEPLPPLFDWRGIYRIHDSRGQVWLLRLLSLPHAADAFMETGRMLQWLEQQQYPVPHVFTTRHRQIVGVFD